LVSRARFKGTFRASEMTTPVTRLTRSEESYPNEPTAAEPPLNIVLSPGFEKKQSLLTGENEDAVNCQ